MKLLDTARRYSNAGLNVLPVNLNKTPKIKWEYLQAAKNNSLEVHFGGDVEGIAVVCGKISGGFEVLDFDNHGGVWYERWLASLPDDLRQLVESLPTEKTQSGGVHVFYRCDGTKTQKLARNANEKTMIETKGEGGYVVVSPTPGYKMIHGDLDDVPTITPQERMRLFDAARACDESRLKTIKNEGNPAPITHATTKTFTGDSVADFLRDNLDIPRQALTRAGWTFLYSQNDVEQWRRPDQPVSDKVGGSLYIDGDKRGVFHCFTSNAAPLEVERSYSPLQLIAALEFRGDISAASKEYAKRYGLNRRSNIFPRAGDVNPYNIPVQTLDMTASGVAYSANGSEPLTAADCRNACLDRQRERLEEQAKRRTTASLEEIDVEALNESFPLKALPDKMQPMTQTQGDRHGTPYAAIAAAGLSVLSGALGCHKTTYSYEGEDVPPLIHTFIVADKGAGKTETTNAFLNPIAKHIETKWVEWCREQQRNAPALMEELKKIDKKLEKKSPLTEDEKKRYREIQSIQRLIKWGGERIRLSGNSSLESLWQQAAMNEIAAELSNQKPHGIVFTLGDATKRVKTDTRKTDDDAAEYWADANDVLDFNETPKKAVTDPERETAKAGAAWILNVQPDHCYFVNGGDTLAGGFDRRFLWVCLPSKDDEENPEEIDLTKLQEGMLSLYQSILNWNGSKFDCGYQDVFKKWRAKMVRRYNEVRRDDKDLAAYIKTLHSKTIHRLTLLLHVCKHVESGEIPETIPPETFKNAAKLIEAFLEFRNLTWRIMRNAVAPSKKRKSQDDDAPKALEELSEQAQKVYRAIGAIMKEKKQGGGASITEINGKVRCYRGKMNRNTIDAELFGAGLMYIDPENGERVALPVYTLDDFSGEMIETTAEEPQEVEEKKKSPLDSVPSNDLSLSNVNEGASQSNNGNGETFHEFDQYDDEDVPF